MAKEIKLKVSRKFIEVPIRIHEGQILKIKGASELVHKVDEDAFDSPFHTLKREDPSHIYEYNYYDCRSHPSLISPATFHRSVANIYEKGYSAHYDEMDSKLKDVGLVNDSKS